MNELDRRALLGAAGLAGVAAMAKAGPIDPPAGPVSPTLKPLSEVEPRIAVNATNTPGDANYLFKITQPGSYYLTGSITGVQGKSGIGIAASDVTLDLNGFAVTLGLPRSGNEHGIALAGYSPRVTVRNGIVSGWGSNGVYLTYGSNTIIRVEDISSMNNGGYGIWVDSGATVARCTASYNTSGGYVSGNGSTFSHCTSFANGGPAFFCNYGTHVNNCTSYEDSSGIRGSQGCVFSDSAVTFSNGTGFSLNGQGSINGCAASLNSGIGFSVQGGCNVTNCESGMNQGGGIIAGGAVSITACMLTGNGIVGIDLASGSTATGCTVQGSPTGFRATNGHVAIVGCTAQSNSSHGFDIGNDSSIIDSTAMDNGGVGILTQASCRVRRCSVRGKNPTAGSVGIQAVGSVNLLEGNSVIAAGIGIKVNTFGSKLIRNTCSANTSNWDVAAGNYCLVVIGAVAGAISGNAGGVASGTTDPDANFSY